MQLTDLNLLRHQAYVDGQWIEADDKARFAVTNPANGELIAEVAALGKAETARAIDAAEAAWPNWARAPGFPPGCSTWSPATTRAPSAAN
jgi:succinate-semialdehyde dehydrogenase/glutarate-semialdehyde dehydrogenase